MNIRTLGVICGVLSGFFWGTMDIAAQYLLHTVRMAPAQFISLTMVVTTVALFGISLATRPKETFLAAADKQNVFQFFLFGVLVLLTQVSFYVCVTQKRQQLSPLRGLSVSWGSCCLRP